MPMSFWLAIHRGDELLRGHIYTEIMAQIYTNRNRDLYSPHSRTTIHDLCPQTVKEQNEIE